MKYLANFTDEFDGTQYQPGDEVKGLDDATLSYLTTNGRLTALGDNDPEVTAIGNSGDDVKPKGRTAGK